MATRWWCTASRDWTGEVSPQDPDGLVLDARFFPLARAIEAVEEIP